MARLLGVDIPDNKRGVISLTYIFGIGRSRAEQVLEQAQVDPSKRVRDWDDEERRKVRDIISSTFKVEGELKSEVQLNIKRLMDIGCYRGLRHRKGLPVRGQQTKNNARTRKGRRKTVAGKKAAPRK